MRIRSSLFAFALLAAFMSGGYPATGSGENDDAAGTMVARVWLSRVAVAKKTHPITSASPTPTATASPLPDATPDPTTSPSPSTTSTPAPIPTPTPNTSETPTPTPTPASSCDGVPVAADASIQAAIDANPSGTTFCLSDAVYSPSSLKPKSGDRFVGPAVLDGGNASAHAFSSSAGSITLDGLEIRRYASVQMDGAVQISGSNWVVKNCYIHHNAAAGVVWNGDGNQILNNRLMSNGEEGFASTLDTNTLFSGNEVGGNNTSHQDWNNEAGGGKFYKSTNLRVVGNWAHDNDGPGLWCDTNCYNVVFEKNKLTNNTAAGIDYEISYDAVIRNNTFSGNGTYHSSSAWYGSAAILVESSKNVEVYGNSSSRDGNGIVLLQESRGSGNRGTYEVSGVSVHDNNVDSPTKQAAGLWNTTSDTSYWSSKSNTFVGNSYRAPSGCTCFAWDDKSLTWSAWRTAGLDDSGSFAVA